LIPCATLGFGHIDVAAGRYVYDQEIDPPTYFAGADEIFWRHYATSGCSYPERTGDYTSVIQDVDFHSLSWLRRQPMYIDFIKPIGLDHSMQLCLAYGPGQQLRLVLHRARHEPVFGERDRALLILLRPHLLAAHQQVVRRRHGVPALTVRQWQLLELVDAGLSNSQIARQLNITVNTVRKHLENVFARLGAASRTDAVRRAYPERIVAATV
jgi:DNA-binding CsgD family transcriptional regulator